MQIPLRAISVNRLCVSTGSDSSNFVFLLIVCRFPISPSHSRTYSAIQLRFNRLLKWFTAQYPGLVRRVSYCCQSFVWNSSFKQSPVSHLTLLRSLGQALVLFVRTNQLIGLSQSVVMITPPGIDRRMIDHSRPHRVQFDIPITG